MRVRRWWRSQLARLATIALGASVLMACHSHVRVAVPGRQPTHPAESTKRQVMAGDHVRVTLHDGSAVEFVVASVDADGFVASDGRHVLYRDITLLEKRHVSAGKTTGLVIVAFAALLITAALISASGSDSSGGGDYGSPKVICTELFDRGLFDARLYATDLQLSRLYISPTTVRGYHLWAIPYVRLMRRSRLATRAIRPLAVAWAQQIGFDYAPDRSAYRRYYTLGRLMRGVGERACWAIGLLPQLVRRKRR